jgi:hypothetical protein
VTFVFVECMSQQLALLRHGKIAAGPTDRGGISVERSFGPSERSGKRRVALTLSGKVPIFRRQSLHDSVEDRER